MWARCRDQRGRSGADSCRKADDRLAVFESFAGGKLVAKNKN